MKKFLCALLAAVFVGSMGIVAQAEAVVDIRVDDVMPDSGYFQPGVLYKIPLYNGDYPLTDEIFDYFRIGVFCYYYDADRDDYVSASKYISQLEMVKQNGRYYLYFMPKAGYAYVEPIDVDICFRARDVDDDEIYYDDQVTVTIGYTLGEDYVMDDEYWVSQDYAIIEFDEDLEECLLHFDDESTYEAHLGNKTKYNFAYSNQENEEIVRANPGAELYFMNFLSSPSFAKSGDLFIASEDAIYLYEINSGNQLKRLTSFRKEGYIGTTTSRLGNYVASDRELVSPAGQSGSGSTSSSSSTGSGSVSSGVGQVQQLFNSCFTNQTVIIDLTGIKGYETTPVQLKTTQSVSPLNTLNLKFYQYDPATNHCTLLTAPNYYFDSTGALYFTATTGKYIVLTDSALTAR